MGGQVGLGMRFKLEKIVTKVVVTEQPLPGSKLFESRRSHDDLDLSTFFWLYRKLGVLGFHNIVVTKYPRKSHLGENLRRFVSEDKLGTGNSSGYST